LLAAGARTVPVQRRLRVLVAEDNEVNQLVARATLESHDLDVDVVGDGRPPSRR
jgi:CheY-like chemotaxis protein